MKKVVLISTVLLLVPLLTACKDEPRNPAGEYGGALMDSYEKARDAAGNADFELIKRAVQQFRGANGEYPESLEDLERFTGIEIDADRYEYDPRTGTITLR
ncbi:MAG: hypothetical protein GXO94_03095 [Nitrospirae bacterium]|nr:hypothetical protein [Nitrospirota bacterium]